jgi:DNA-binding transcriptional regulator YiaG
MKKSDINELLRLKGWSKARLAAELELGENAVHKWLAEDRTPGGPASVLMRLWLREARGEIRIVEIEQTEPVPA